MWYRVWYRNVGFFGMFGCGAGCAASSCKNPLPTRCPPTYAYLTMRPKTPQPIHPAMNCGASSLILRSSSYFHLLSLALEVLRCIVFSVPHFSFTRNSYPYSPEVGIQNVSSMTRASHPAYYHCFCYIPLRVYIAKTGNFANRHPANIFPHV